ncbi:hypothetical protein DUI87_35279 [Hirundo rustica rustica]|uniref:Fibronectin type-III domain-containing protein n=1 Tax=Hirundo rustica rustica TaxID=333673 RepID=A0A3M0IGY2_HIRRU|nr:hypothetical protein DUI87_35279 [Hirundo rustica rustica]
MQAVLGELKVSSVSPDSMQLQWSVPRGPFDSFMLQYRDAQGQPQALPIDGRSHSVTVPGLSPSHRYHFHLYGLQGRRKIDHVSTEAVTGTEDPEELPRPSEDEKHEKPQDETPPSDETPMRAVLGELRVSSITPSSVGLQWSVPEGSFDSFMLQYRDAQGQPQALAIDGESRSVTVPGLTPSRRYRFHLYGMQGRKKTDRVSIDITTATAVLEELRVSSITPNSVQLQWSVPRGSFDSFMLQYRDAQGQPQALPIDGTSRSVTVPGLSPSHRYRFHLYGLHGAKRIDRVSTDTVTASEEPLPSEEPQQEKPKTEFPASETLPVRPVLEELKVSSVTPNSVQLQWSVPKGSFDSFMLQYRDAQGQPQALPIDGGSRSVTVPGLSPSHRYRFHLYGLRGKKKINHVSTEAVTAGEEREEQPLSPEEPQHEKPQTEAPASEAPPTTAVLEELRVSSITPNSVQLQWSVPRGSFDSFMLQYRDAQGQPQALPIDGTSRSVTVPGLSPSHRYRFHLYGLRGAKRIDRVSTDTVTASEEPLPSEEPQEEGPKTESPASQALPVQAVLEELKVSSVTPNSVQLQWSVPKGSFDSFMLQYPRDAQGQPQALPIDGGSRSVTVPGLSPSHRYRFHLYGLWGKKKINHVSTEAVTAGEEPEEQPLSPEEPQQEKPQTEAPTSEATPTTAVLEELRVSSVTPKSVQLQWSVPRGSFDSFMLQYRDAQGQPQALPIDGTSRSVTVPGLAPSHRYRFHLYGLRGKKKINHVSTEAVTAGDEPEEQPLSTEEPQHEKPQTEAPASEAPPTTAVLEELRVSSITPSSVQLQWSVPRGSFDSFMLQYRDAQGQPQALPIDGTSRSVTVPGLSPSRRYRFHLYGLRGKKKINHVSTEAVTAGDEPEEQPLSTEEPQHEKPQTEAPASEAPPTMAVLEELRVSSITPNSVQLQWSVPRGSFDSFMLQYRDAQGQPQALPIDGTSRSVTVPGLSPSRRLPLPPLWVAGQEED